MVTSVFGELSSVMLFQEMSDSSYPINNLLTVPPPCSKHISGNYTLSHPAHSCDICSNARVLGALLLLPGLRSKDCWPRVWRGEWKEARELKWHRSCFPKLGEMDAHWNIFFFWSPSLVDEECDRDVLCLG